MADWATADLMLSEFVTVVGNGQATTGPHLQHETWHVTHLATNSDSTSQPTVQHYRNFVSPTMLLEGTYAGNLDQDTVADFHINQGDSIVTVVSGASAGAHTSTRFEGTRTIPYMGYQ